MMEVEIKHFINHKNERVKKASTYTKHRNGEKNLDYE